MTRAIQTRSPDVESKGGRRHHKVQDSFQAQLSVHRGMGDGFNQRFILTGANASECVIAGPIKKYMDNGTNCNWRFIKKGSGVWRFSNVANTEMAGVIAVENGTLRYDSIADAGRVCSLGYSDQLFEDYTGRVMILAGSTMLSNLVQKRRPRRIQFSNILET